MRLRSEGQTGCFCSEPSVAARGSVGRNMAKNLAPDVLLASFEETETVVEIRVSWAKFRRIQLSFSSSVLSIPEIHVCLRTGPLGAKHQLGPLTNTTPNKTENAGKHRKRKKCTV